MIRADDMRGPCRKRAGIGLRILGCSILVITLAGCQTGRNEPSATGSISRQGVVAASDMTEEQAVGAVQVWGAAYTRNGKDKTAALNYAAALRASGESGQAVAVMRKAAIYHPEDREVLAAFGKALASDGQFEEALATVTRAQRADNPDWQLLSTEGGILDSIGRHDEARARYRQALVLAPGEPQVLNNLGLSYLLTNELGEAEQTLRTAAASPRATLKVRENLDLVMQLKSGGSARAAVASDAGAAVAPKKRAAVPAAPRQDTWAELSGT